MINDYITFVKELPVKFKEIGAMIPSSSVLGKAMIKPVIEAKERPLNILEAGPGTGPITRQILKHMNTSSNLTICEINPRFITRLKTALLKNKNFQKHQSRTQFFQGPVQELPKNFPLAKYDVIVSSLPFSNFEPSLVREIFSIYEQILKPNGKITFVEYMGMRRISALVTSKENRHRVKKVEEVISTIRKNARMKGNEDVGSTMLNVPPAKVICICYN